MTDRIRYRRLPGRRRGWLRGATVWLGPDHLLSVKSVRVREDYKRFHFRDVQAIAVARAPRFHVSTRAIPALLLWLTAYVVALRAAPGYTWALWTLAAAAVLAWAVVSGRWSCRCRIYTAVSSEELPSVYRTWTARKFLAEVEPRIAEVQGMVEAGWAEAAEAKSSASQTPAFTAPEAAAPAATGREPKVHTLAADLFVFTLCAHAAADLLVLRSTSAVADWTQIVFGLALLAETVILFVQYYRGLLAGAMQKLAIANLIAIGVLYYVRQFIVSFEMGAQRGPGTTLKIPTFYAGNAWTRGIDAGVCIILGLVGLGIIFLHEKRPEAAELSL